ncbi:protein with DOMON-like ligand-binding domain protein [Winogradskyella sp. PC-19]|uniref:DUF5916 domain-containing protein n=1 Tax=unclassified Winogradskyella TaxID=2615021 RepID=UPI000B3BF005|nr:MULTISPECIES: DUF5916 domain-containing protein [unclassified Winogradskyella]ARV08628.1 protein with DOMON-like ligand-binding domain protein [Winogradskyella sp. PC-19]RZN81476.1 MAG: protein with DOMON-like ligand-binding domain protein [Winogradskyella sp.]
MYPKALFISFFSLCIATISFAQTKKVHNIERTNKSPKIDGILDDTAWRSAEIATDFISFQPEIGLKAPNSERTEVKMTYDDQAIYVSAYMYDDPSKIMKQLTNRDDFGQSDFFLLVLNPNNDAQNDITFFVFASGQQADAIVNPTIGEDFGWNAVWQSAVKINDDGWTVEMKIPYRALRFPEQETPTWGIQYHREVRRTRTRFTWNPIDPTQGNIGLYHGELKGLDNIKPPVRLNLYPFMTGIASEFDGESETDLRFGLDVKYGITDNFTLDATLVPDFSQVGFDNLELNLGPFEQTFREQRQFFTEGVDLFSKGGLFFSRRIGSAPIGNVDLADGENLNRPNTTKVLNAIKVSGRTKSGLGIGILNAITEKTTATVTDDNDVVLRDEVVEPLANYSVLAIDQQYNGNSSISLINTNVLREGSFRDANATALVSNFQNKRNTFRVDTELRMSYVDFQGAEAETGFSSFLFVGKTHGNWRYSFDHRFADTKYNINDLGLNLRNNLNNFGADWSYEIFEPTEKLNRYRINGFINYERLASPNTFTGLSIGINYFAIAKRTLDAYGFNFRIRPGKQFNYFESRDGRPFIFENFARVGGFISTNYDRPFAYDIRASVGAIFEDGRDFTSVNLELEPRYRFNDKFLLIYNVEYDKRKGERGFATRENDETIFGERDRRRVTNTITANYTFNPLHTVSLNLRHYWDTVDYDQDLFTLLDNGRLTTASGYNLDNISSDPNVNFSTWNVDLSYQWQFAPGSFLTALYRNQLFNVNDDAFDTFSGSLNNLFEQPALHQFSLRLQYFIDFNGIKSVFKKNNSSS